MAQSDSESDFEYNSLSSPCSDDDVRLGESTVSEGVRNNCNAMTLWDICNAGLCESLKYLIATGIDINGTDENGDTALHQSVECRQLECVKILVENGARLDIECGEVTPVQQASIGGEADIVKYFVNSPWCTRAVKIDALELLGAAYVDEKENIENAYYYWLWSLRERARAEPGDNVQPKRDEPHPTFGNKREFHTEEELTTLAFCVDDMRMQALIMRERILGRDHYYTSCFVKQRAFAYANVGNFERTISLMTYILDIEHKSDRVIFWTLKDLSELIDMFATLMLEGSPVEYKDVMAVFTMIVNVIEHNVKLHSKRKSNYTMIDYELYLIIRSLSTLSQLQPSISEDENLQLRKALRRFVQLNVRDHKGRTPLHLVCKNNMTPYSPLDVVQLLMKVGADPQAVSLNGDTPLHTLATNQHRDQPHIIRLFLNSGVHYDACNAKGKRFTDLLGSDNVFKFENPMQYLTLQCLCAKAVKNHGISYESEVPSIVSEFIKIH